MQRAEFFSELSHSQIFKDNQVVCGDSFISRRGAEDNHIISVLSDGLGSGIKASVLSTLTASMALNYVIKDRNLIKAASIIMDTLPVDTERKISYSTFTIVDIDYKGQCRIINYDNPPFILMRDSKVVEISQQKVSGINAQDRKYELSVAEFNMKQEDRLIFFSDGVSQSGMGSARYPFGWSYENIVEYLQFLLRKDNSISARRMSSKIVDHALANFDFKAKDDITCAVIYMRKPRELLIISGASIDKDNDKAMAAHLADFKGKTAICGGTTAKIMSRELEQEVVMNILSLDPEIPCYSEMKGVDLVTEGMITLAKTLEIFKDGCHSYEMNKDNGAAKLAQLILESDHIEFLIGTKINEVHQDPNLPLELGIRRNTIKSLASVLDEIYLKKTVIKYI